MQKCQKKIISYENQTGKTKTIENKPFNKEEKQMSQFPRNERHERGFFSKTDWKPGWR